MFFSKSHLVICFEMLEISLGSFCRRCRVNVDSAPVFSVFAPLLLTIKLPGKIEAFLGADERLCGTSITVQIVADKVLNARRLVNLLKYHHAWMWTSVSVLLYSLAKLHGASARCCIPPAFHA
ncbi:hypothetical protein ACFX1Q_031191 [Malus domestica]